ncbi:MAG: putative DNA binding domain-containing protein [Clostridiales bacterium]|nr:putative DNA binding domain-containing protein [Clostridiales bacterium]
MDLKKFIGESTEYDKKQAVETKKPKSWLKSVSAFANTVGGVLIFGVTDDEQVVGLEDIKNASEYVSQKVKERISPFPQIVMQLHKVEDGKDILTVRVPAGTDTPYYYVADGVTEAYIRIGNESALADSTELKRLVLRGNNSSYDALISPYDYEDYSFSKLRERYKSWTGNSMTEKMMESFGVRDASGKLTNAGALLADDCPIRHSRLFCTRWNGLDKSGGQIDAIDSGEFSGSLIILLNEGLAFVKRNMKTMWKKTDDSRIEMPDYCERSILESLVNGLIHRDYLVNGSEVHIDMYDDRLTIYSPGGMPDGTQIQEWNIDDIPSTRRNPILADIFGRLGYMERQGSGLGKIIGAYENAANYEPDLTPKFFSNRVCFIVTLWNLNFKASRDEAINEALNEAINEALKPEALDLIALMKSDPTVTQATMIQTLGLSRSKVQRVIKALTDDGYIKREGSKKTGRWVILKEV